MPDRAVVISVKLEGLTDASAQASQFSNDVRGIGDAATGAAAPAQALGTAIDKTQASLTGAAAAAHEARTSLSSVGEAAPSFDRVSVAAAAADAALEKLGAATGIRGLRTQIVQTQLAMDTLRTAIAAAEASGGNIGEAARASLARLETQVQASKQRLGLLMETQASVTTSANMLGRSWETAALSGGSMQGMMLRLAETSTGFTGALGKLSLGALGVGAAFKLGLDIGQKFNESLVGVEKAAGGSGNALAGLAKVIGDTNIAGEGFKKWADEAAKATARYGDELEPVTLKVNNLMKVHQAAAKSLSEDEAKLKTLGVVWDDVDKDASNLAKTIKVLDDTLAQSKLKGDDMTRVWAANAKEFEALRKAIDAGEVSFDSLSKRMQMAILMADAMVAADERAAKGKKVAREGNEQLNTSIVNILTTYRREMDASVGAADAADREAAAKRKLVAALAEFGKQNGLTAEQVANLIAAQSRLLDATNDATQEGIDKQTFALEKLGAGLDEAARKTDTAAEAQKRFNQLVAEGARLADEATNAIKTRNQALADAEQAQARATEAAKNGIVVEGQATPIYLQVAKATDAQTAALEGLLRAQNAYSDAVAKTLDIASGWKDYLAGLVDSYQRGATSLLAYKEALISFETQLQQTFAGATGNAKAALETMIQTIQKLIETAGAGGGGAADTSYTGQLNKAFNT